MHAGIDSSPLTGNGLVGEGMDGAPWAVSLASLAPALMEVLPHLCRYQLLKTHQLPLDAFLVSLKMMQVEEVDIDEVQCILANLIYMVRPLPSHHKDLLSALCLLWVGLGPQFSPVPLWMAPVPIQPTPTGLSLQSRFWCLIRYLIS